MADFLSQKFWFVVAKIVFNLWWTPVHRLFPFVFRKFCFLSFNRVFRHNVCFSMLLVLLVNFLFWVNTQYTFGNDWKLKSFLKKALLTKPLPIISPLQWQNFFTVAEWKKEAQKVREICSMQCLLFPNFLSSSCCYLFKHWQQKCLQIVSHINNRVACCILNPLAIGRSGLYSQY